MREIAARYQGTLNTRYEAGQFDLIVWFTTAYLTLA